MREWSSKEDTLRISKFFSLSRTQVELDFVDIDVNRDTPLFIDPYFLSQRSDPWSIGASHTIRSFFGYFLALLHDGDRSEARDLFDHLHEPNETCLGMSKKRPNGKGVADGDAQKIFESIAGSTAAKTGILADLEDCRVFVRGVDKDKTSDMTTNIIRQHLIEYTQRQCDLWGIPLTRNSPSGFWWNRLSRSWDNDYSDNLFVKDRRILLVPKAIVSFSKRHTPKQYHQHFVLNFLQHEHLRLQSSLVRRKALKNGTIHEWVTKKDLVGKGGAKFDKDFLASFTKAHPQVFSSFKKEAKHNERSIPIEDFGGIDIEEICAYLENRLGAIPPGKDSATDYHRAVVGILDFLFYPDLINPLIEKEINEGRKRIDFTFDNAGTSNFFLRLSETAGIPCPFILGECKNYSRDVANPELDQIAGRCSANRGRVGIVVSRKIDDLSQFLNRCRDTLRDDNKLIIPLTDEDLINGLRARSEGEFAPLEKRLSDLYREIAL